LCTSAHPVTPSPMNRPCHRHTTGFDLPDRRLISAVPQPSAVARMMLARQTCFCGALRSEMIASSRWRSARVTFTTIPALMMRACTASDNLGIVRMNQTTRYHTGPLAMGTLVSALRTVARRPGSHVWGRIELEQPGINVAGICTVRQGTQPGRNLVGGKPALVDERMALAQHCVVADVAKLGAALD